LNPLARQVDQVILLTFDIDGFGVKAPDGDLDHTAAAVIFKNRDGGGLTAAKVAPGRTRHPGQKGHGHDYKNHYVEIGGVQFPTFHWKPFGLVGFLVTTREIIISDHNDKWSEKIIQDFRKLQNLSDRQVNPPSILRNSLVSSSEMGHSRVSSEDRVLGYPAGMINCPLISRVLAAYSSPAGTLTRW